MERTRTNNKFPSAILTGDWHLRDDTPICRTDDYEAAQWRKVDFISKLQKQYDCPILHSGDLFNTWKPSPYLLAKTMEHLPKQFNTIYGNHDLPQHNLELANKCGINVLAQSGYLTVLEYCHWNQRPTEASIVVNPDIELNILVWHVMAYQGKLPWPGCSDPLAAGILRKYPQYDLILLGHNHIPFKETYEGRLLLNPGSIMRQNADQIDYRPAVWLWYADMNTVEPVYLPIDKDIISTDHLDVKKERDGRIDAFITRLNEDWDATISFEDNLEEFKKNNTVRKSIMDIIYKAIES